MSRYFSKPKARVRSDDDDYWYEPPLITNITVCDHEAVDTGILDANGDTIYRAPNCMGFIWGD